MMISNFDQLSSVLQGWQPKQYDVSNTGASYITNDKKFQ